MKCEHCNQRVTDEKHVSVESCNNTGRGVTLHEHCYKNFLKCNFDIVEAEIEYWRNECVAANKKLQAVRKVLL